MRGGRSGLKKSADNLGELESDLIVQLASFGGELDLVEVKLDLGQLDEEAA